MVNTKNQMYYRCLYCHLNMVGEVKTSYNLKLNFSQL